MSVPPKSPELARLSQISQEITWLEETLPYADGPAYYNDKRKLFELQKEHHEILQKLKIHPN